MAPADELFSVSLRDLANKRSPTHGSVNLASLRLRIVLEDFPHQSRIVRENDARLEHAQKPNLPLGLTERSYTVTESLGPIWLGVNR